MRLLLDECVPRQLTRQFAEYEVQGAAVGVVLIVAARTDLPFLIPHVEAAKASST